MTRFEDKWGRGRDLESVGALALTHVELKCCSYELGAVSS